MSKCKSQVQLKGMMDAFQQALAGNLRRQCYFRVVGLTALVLTGGPFIGGVIPDFKIDSHL